MGLTCMGGVLSPDGEVLPWMALHPGGSDRMGEKAYLALLSNLLIVPTIVTAPVPHQIYFEEVGAHRNKYPCGVRTYIWD